MPPTNSINRRHFLQSTAATTVGAALAGHTAWADDASAKLPSADAFIAGKDPRLIVHNAKVGEIETPLVLLREERITPKALLFVRNNQVLPGTLTTDPAAAGKWRVELSGLIDKPRTVAVSELAKLPQDEHEVVLQCSGNGRAFFSRTAKADGAQWQHGAMGNVVFKGVPLQGLLDHLGAELDAEAQFVTAEGADKPDKAGAADFEHSLPLEDVLERSILALEMNGEPIPRVHGGPVRLVTPGFYGTMHVKWLSRLRFEAEESTNHHHAGRYRTPLRPIEPGSKFTSTLENSEPNWNMRIKSAIFSPREGEQVTAGKVTVRGVAWNDGTAQIESVEVSVDAGQTWRRAELTRPESPYAWHDWNLVLELSPGKQTILSRAIDVLGLAQPLDGSIYWNPAGYAWNGVDAVEVAVD